MKNVFITGDKHGKYTDVMSFCHQYGTTKDDLLIVLGDNGVNYYGNKSDYRLKERLEALPISFLMIKGNHDMRPNPESYQLKESKHPLLQGDILIEDEFPSLMFTPIFSEYQVNINDAWYSSYVLGGAYSVDKWYRLGCQARGLMQYKWFADEQMSQEEMEQAKEDIPSNVSFIFTHTCPYKYIPRDTFLTGIDQSTVDDTMEHWLDTIEKDVQYTKWFCGHWHIDRKIDKLHFMYNDIILLEK